MQAAISGRGTSRTALIAGAGGPLGSAVVEQVLSRRRFTAVSVLVTQPLLPALKGLLPLTMAQLEGPVPRDAEDTAIVVFDRERHANGRDAAFVRVEPSHLLGLAHALLRRGVRRLLVVMPHAPGSLPEALKQGLAGLDEQAVASLGFEHVLFIRSALAAAPKRYASFGDRFAALMLSQLRFVIPARDQPVRAAKTAAFAAALAGELVEAPPGARVVSPEWVWEASQTRDIEALARHWLQGGAEHQALALQDWLKKGQRRGES